MIKEFTNNAILTTPNPECFLNFAFSPGDPSYWILPEVSTNGIGKFLVNGIDAQSPSVGYAVRLNADVGEPGPSVITCGEPNGGYEP